MQHKRGGIHRHGLHLHLHSVEHQRIYPVYKFSLHEQCRKLIFPFLERCDHDASADIHHPAFPEEFQGIQLPVADERQRVVRCLGEIRETEFRSGLYAIQREAVFQLVRYEYGIPFLKLVQERGALGNQFQQRNQYDTQDLHLFANKAIRPFT